jgi:hypothetical protein
MNESIYLCLSVGVLAAAVITALTVYRRTWRVRLSLNLLLTGVLLALVALYMPVYFQMEKPDLLQCIRVVFLSAFSGLRTLGIDGDYEIISQCFGGNSLYLAYASVLLVIAPLLTFGVVLSFFRNAFAGTRLLLNRHRRLRVFSVLNHKSLALARSLREKGVTLVFADVKDSEDPQQDELQEQAAALGAILFKKDILDIHWDDNKKSKGIWFFAIDENEENNLRLSLRLIERYGTMAQHSLFVFSSGPEGEVLLQDVSQVPMRVRRINDVQFNVHHLLHRQGLRLFETAAPGVNGTKQIRAVVIGMGRHGTEMVKALSWYGQMDGYQIRIDAFDDDPLALEKFAAQCPELMDPRHNGTYKQGDAQYYINIHSGVDVHTRAFLDILASLPPATYVLVALGNDLINIRTALDLRTRFIRLNCQPIIQAIVYGSEMRKMMTDAENRKSRHQVECIFDLQSTYSRELVDQSSLEADALRRHRKWGDEASFWNSEYNYRSSITLAIASEARQKLGIDVGNPDVIGPLEKRRWNAYMRANGYVFSGSTEEKSRNDLGKMHPNLVNYYDLPNNQKVKDVALGGK